MLYKSPPPFHHTTLDIKNKAPLPAYHAVGGGRAQSARIHEKKSTLAKKSLSLHCQKSK